jgi:hypothetical protein
MDGWVDGWMDGWIVFHSLIRIHNEVLNQAQVQLHLLLVYVVLAIIVLDHSVQLFPFRGLSCTEYVQDLTYGFQYEEAFFLFMKCSVSTDTHEHAAAL